MKRTVLFLSFVLFVFFDAKAQDVPSIIPPSPNAAAFHVYGNTNLNYYTGSADISIPIFEIKEGDLTLPIYLKYTGGNGIKVEETASWVGLGWTLNAGGAISRTIRGIADEDETKVGFFQMTEIPIISEATYDLIDNIGDGLADGEADKFMYNYPGGSGSFFYNYDKSIYFKPKRNIEVTHNIGIESEPVTHTNCATYGEVITDFTVIDEYGNSFLFEDKERSNTINLGSPYSDNRGFPTTWYLSKMENLNKTREISFDYDPYVYTLRRSNSIYSVVEAGEIDTYSETTYIGKRLSLITFSQGTVEFHESTSYRKDLGNNNYLDNILVKDKQGNIIKTIKFNYQYMTPTGMMSESVTTAHDYDNRLILTSVEECDASDNCKSPTVFTYETSQFLPSRLSKAQDHWGYYNGATTNTKLEPENFITYYDPVTGNWETILRGSADRNPNLSYSKAGVLKEIQYPTGGKTVFDYESHTAVNNDISGVLTQQNINLMWEDVVTSFTVQLSSDANPLTKLRVSGFYSDPVTGCIPEIYIKNLTTNQIHLLSLPNGINPDEVFLESGSYQAWFELESEITSTCTQDDPASILLKWDNEDDSPTKIVGGLRIKSLSTYTDDNTLATKRNFSYTGDDTNSSGRIVNVPKYWGLHWDHVNELPIGYERYVQPAIPLATTQGSDVGYGKVTFSYEGEVNGKTENYYSTPANFPDNTYRVNPIDGSEYINIHLGIYFEVYPKATTDSRDLFRGRLDKQISYKKSNSTFMKVTEKLFTYEMLGSYHHPSALLPEESRTVRGIKVRNNEGELYVTYYDIFTGYNLPSQTITKQYNDVGVLTETTTQKYDVNVNGFAEYYTPTSTETIGSDGITLKQNTEYVFNKDSASKTTSEIDLTSKNALYLPLKTETYKDATKLTTTYTVYDNDNSNWTGLNLPKSIQSSTGTNSLEDRVIYHSYDDKGNVQEVSKADGTHISYVWGYDDTYPIAKVQNAEVGDFLYENFEEGGFIIDRLSTTEQKTGNYSTGACYADWNNKKLVTFEEGKDYIVSFWTKKGTSSSYSRIFLSSEIGWVIITPPPTGEWVFMSQKVHIPIGSGGTRYIYVLAGSGSSTDLSNYNYVDDLRIYPADALMTTYTYEPLVGMTSATNERNQTTYYEYDDFNRLGLVKNTDKDIVQKTNYHYQIVPFMDVTTSTINANPSGSVHNVSVSTNVPDWTVSDNSGGWLMVVKSGDEAIVTVSNNDSGSSRSATVTFDGGGELDYITVNQDYIVPVVSVSPSNYTFSSIGQSFTISVSSNTAWTASTVASWLTITPSSGSNNGSILVNCVGTGSFKPSNVNITNTATGAVHSVTVYWSDLPPL